MNPDYDMGEDGQVGSGAPGVARDVYGFALNYYKNDYQPIASGVKPFAKHWDKMPSGHTAKQLYNGNISSISVAIGKLGLPQLYNYSYDQLNRIVGMDVYRGLDSASNTWSSPLTAVNDYKERVSYDGNGNIQTYLRNGFGTTLDMDNLQYHYIAGSNKLARVTDAVSASNYTEDIDIQIPNNYTYDAIGNLVSDTAGKIKSITWNVYGKITNIGKDIDGPNQVSAIDYRYDPSGNRVGKKVYMYDHPPYKARYTWYVRDAQGNVMAVYESSYGSIKALQFL